MKLKLFAFLALALLAGCTGQGPQTAQNATPTPLGTNGTVTQPQQPPGVNASRLQIPQVPEYVCDMFGNQTRPKGVGGADLGIPVVNGSSQWLLFGDTFVDHSISFQGPSGGAGGSSIISSGIPLSCTDISYVMRGGKYFQPLTSKRIDGVDASTVPAGAININGTVYIFAMRVMHWPNATDPNPAPAYGVLFRQEADGTFSEIANWTKDQPHVNTAPAEGKLPDGTDAVFMAMTGTYRDSPVYLSYVLPSDIGNTSRYHYLSGYAQDGSPLWSDSISGAVPLPGLEGVRAGELSLVYDEPLKRYLLMLNDYQKPYSGFKLYSSETPYGPFTTVGSFFPCGSEGAGAKVPRPSWMESGWGGCYGGYMIPGDFGADGHDLYFTVSAWVPYTTVLMKTRLDYAQ